MPENNEERTEQATPRRRQKAREQGQIARSKDLVSFSAAGGLLMIIYFAGRNFIENISNLSGKLLGLQYGRDPFTVFRAASTESVIMLLPFLGAAFFFAIAGGIAQGGIVLKPLKLKLEAVNPVKGLQRIFSMNGLMDFLKNLLKFSIGAYLFYYVIKKDLQVLPALAGLGVNDIAQTAGNLLFKAVLYGFFCFFVIAIIDFLMQKWQFERSLRMSVKELKEEQKETEGDPLLKARIKSIQRDMARRRMMQEVPKATVVITNPTHLAVALVYEDKKMEAPKVIAKGAGFMAQRIREIASENKIPVVEDKPLARALFKLDIGSYIPQELYKAVAKLLAYIYKLKGAA